LEALGELRKIAEKLELRRVPKLSGGETATGEGWDGCGGSRKGEGRFNGSLEIRRFFFSII
jgi:hypothetical protein